MWWWAGGAPPMVANLYYSYTSFAHWPDITVRPGGPDRVAGSLPRPRGPVSSVHELLCF